jgi:hypothetical protein
MMNRLAISFWVWGLTLRKFAALALGLGAMILPVWR